MTLKKVEGPPGAPWDRSPSGTVEKLTVHSELLEGNPLGDPAERPLYVYLPPTYDPGADDGYPAIYVIQGMTGQLDMWLGRSAFEPTMFERLDALYEDDSTPPAVIVFVDAWTSYGGSQFLDSTSTGPYMSYLCDEVVPFIDANYATVPEASKRGITGKSSGGYGAMVVPMERPGIFGALHSTAGDALFEVCYQRDFPDTARILRDSFEGSYEVFWERFAERENFDFNLHGHPLDTYAMAAAYSPDPDNPGKVFLPFDISTGRLDEEVWSQWLRWDPVRMASGHVEELKSLRQISLDAGRRDQYYLDLGAIAFGQELDKAGIPHELELFEGTHLGLQYRYPAAIRRLIAALA